MAMINDLVLVMPDTHINGSCHRFVVDLVPRVVCPLPQELSREESQVFEALIEIILHDLPFISPLQLNGRQYLRDLLSDKWPDHSNRDVLGLVNLLVVELDEELEVIIPLVLTLWPLCFLHHAYHHLATLFGWLILAIWVLLGYWREFLFGDLAEEMPPVGRLLVDFADFVEIDLE